MHLCRERWKGVMCFAGSDDPVDRARRNTRVLQDFSRGFAANVTSDSLASACASEMIPARWRSFPVGMPKAASTSSDGMVLEPNATPENRNRAELGRVDMESLRPFC